MESESPELCPEPIVLPTRNISPAQIDPDALKVVRRLQRHGHAAYLVGGCVRDLLLRRTPKDFDVATSAQPNEIRKLFRNCRLIGRRFRLAHIHFRQKIIETATFRAGSSEAASDDLLIRSDNVFGTECEDAYRRDFTINALFYDPVEGVLIDYVGGIEDLVERRLRFIGEPEIRVQEDPVRILRAIKFAARLGFAVESRTWRAAVRYRDQLARAAPPRLLEEINRMLHGGAAEASFRLMWESRVLGILLPEVAQFLARAPERGEVRDPGAGLWAYLRAIDAGPRAEWSPAVLLSAVLMHPVFDAADGAADAYDLRSGSSAAGEVARELLRRIVERIRLPRWEAERIQQLVAAQRRLAAPGRGGTPPRALQRRAYFSEALDLFEIGVRATGKGRAVLERLRGGKAYKPPAATELAPEMPAPVAAPADSPPEPPKRRRRRRRRKRPAPAPKA